MKLKTNQLRQFKSAASSIKQNGILPILSYLKFDNGSITKNNLESFLTMKADFKGQMLVDEKILMNFVDFTTAEEITVTITDKSVLITDGKTKVTSPTDDITHFPVSDTTDNKPVEIKSEVLWAIKVASNFTTEDTSNPFKECVFVGNGIVAASNGFICYLEKVSKKIPNIIIGKDAANSITKFEEVLFSDNNTYCFYETDIFKMGFVKTEVKFVDMAVFLTIPEGEQIEIKKSEIIKFCDICINSTTGRLVTANINGNQLSMVDSSYGINIETPISATLENFVFNPILMQRLLKSLPDESVKFIKGTNKYFIIGDSGFVSLIMEIVS